MVVRFKLLILFILLLTASACFGQDYEISTVFKGPRHKASGGYGAITNKFTEINGQYANMVEMYGGWYINHRFLLGIGGAAVTNNIQVPAEFATVPETDMSYAYAQFGLVTEYTLWSHRAVHLTFHAMNGPGVTAQYMRNDWQEEDQWDEDDNYPHDTNWFFVSEPGIKVEVNIFRWMRISPGVSYRAAFGSSAKGLTDSKLSGTSLNVTMKFGKF
jgi:hypothetical protein